MTCILVFAFLIADELMKNLNMYLPQLTVFSNTNHFHYLHGLSPKLFALSLPSPPRKHPNEILTDTDLLLFYFCKKYFFQGISIFLKTNKQANIKDIRISLKPLDLIPDPFQGNILFYFFFITLLSCLLALIYLFIFLFWAEKMCFLVHC